MITLIPILLTVGLCLCVALRQPYAQQEVPFARQTLPQRLAKDSVPVASDQALHLADQLPRTFTGTYRWTTMDRPGLSPSGNFVTLRIHDVSASDEVVHFQGIHIYEPDRQIFHVVGQIDSRTHTLTILESKEGDPVESSGPNRVVVAITNGSFEGRISEDLRAIDAEWTTRHRNMTGVLAITAQ